MGLLFPWCQVLLYFICQHLVLLCTIKRSVLSAHERDRINSTYIWCSSCPQSSSPVCFCIVTLQCAGRGHLQWGAEVVGSETHLVLDILWLCGVDNCPLGTETRSVTHFLHLEQQSDGNSFQSLLISAGFEAMICALRVLDTQYPTTGLASFSIYF